MIGYVEQAWIIHCSRCANHEIAYTDTIDGAVDHFKRLGWGVEGSRMMCPLCRADVSSG